MNHKRKTSFWLWMALLQVGFGLAVFAATRAYYLPDASIADSNGPPPAPVIPVWKERTPAGGNPFGPATMGPAIPADPIERARQADTLFSGGQYEQAAVLYQELLASGAGNVNVYNNLGITLHYLDRSDEALQWLNEGVAMDPGYQRIWLTLGFVNSQVGNLEQARAALTRAVEIDPANEVGQSAAGMLQKLP
ncbi:MAG: tetratricopeptide repeat protein [Gammaproteobacteria bacterium]